jgi:DNA-binding NtrC family response regulator
MAAARVLIVEDEPGVLSLLDRFLSIKGYDTEATSSPRQALEIVTTKPRLDIVVIDAIMPEMSGPELAKKIVRLSPSTAVVMMSGYPSTPEIPPHASFIRKPFSLDDLFAVVERTLARSRELQKSLSQAYEETAELTAQSKDSSTRSTKSDTPLMRTFADRKRIEVGSRSRDRV